MSIQQRDLKSAAGLLAVEYLALNRA